MQSRLIASELQTSLGQPVVVENKPGAGGNIAAAYAAHAEADGYTLFMGTTGTNASNVSLYTALEFDPARRPQDVSEFTRCLAEDLERESR